MTCDSNRSLLVCFLSASSFMRIAKRSSMIDVSDLFVLRYDSVGVLSPKLETSLVFTIALAFYMN